MTYEMDAMMTDTLPRARKPLMASRSSKGLCGWFWTGLLHGRKVPEKTTPLCLPGADFCRDLGLVMLTSACLQPLFPILACEGISQAQPGKRLSRQVPLRSLLFSSITKEFWPARRRRMPMHSPLKPQPTISTWTSGRTDSAAAAWACGRRHCTIAPWSRRLCP